VNDAVEKYFAYLKHERRLAALTLKHYRRDLDLLLALAAGADAGTNTGKRDSHARRGAEKNTCNAAPPVPLADLTQMDIRRFAAQLHARGLSPTSLARVLSSWRGFFDYLKRESGAANPVDGVRAPKAAKRLPQTLSPDEAVKLVTIEGDDAAHVRDRAMFELLYSSGLRVSELTGLDVDAIDFNTAEARVLGKGGKVRIVPVGGPALDALRAWLRVRETITPHPQHPPGNALFLSAVGRRYNPRQVQQRIKAIAVAQGISADVHPHMLRHSFASHVLQSSGDLRAVQEMLGHASIASTQVYTHLDFQHLAKVYDTAHPRAKKK
jgi:integrase/recombinase XerC